jgi:hypothetical protein
MCSKFHCDVCEQNGSAICLHRHHFLPHGGKGGRCGTNWPSKVVGIATLLEFDENYRFLTASCGPYMSHTLHLFSHFT